MAALELYRGRVSHARLGPRPHSFVYATSFVVVDVDALKDWADRRWFFGYNRLRPVCLFDRDYLDADGRSIREKFAARIDSAPIDRLLLLTTPRSLWKSFNPLSLYFGYAKGELIAVLAEVSNTYGERYAYRLELSQGHEDRWRAQTAKALFVSPFFGVKGHYVFEFDEPGERFALALRLVVDGRDAIRTHLTGRRAPSRALAGAAVAAVYSGLMALPRIGHQAILMRLKGVKPLLKPRPPMNALRREGDRDRPERGAAAPPQHGARES